MLIVGSKSLKYHFPEIERDIKDIDIIGNTNDINQLITELKPKKVLSTDYITSLIDISVSTDIFNTKNVEVLNSDRSEALSEYLRYEKVINSKEIKFASPEVLLSLKKSHIHFPIKFQKHIEDYSLLLRKLGEDKLRNITKLNFKETEKRIGKLKTPSLKQKTKTFFDQSKDFVKYIYNHDDIHLVMSHFDRPIYEDMQEDGSSVFCQKKLWNKFSHDKKVKCVLEEAYVISLERKIIPMLNGLTTPVSSKDAFLWSLMRICTTLCSGFFREFATDNWTEIKNSYNKDYVLIFLEAESNGLIKKI